MGDPSSRPGPDRTRSLEALARAWALHESGRLEDAAVLIDQVLATDPDCVEAWCYRGMSLHDRGRPTEAIAAYMASLERTGPVPSILNNLGNALLATGRFDEARSVLETVLLLAPDHARAWYNLGVVHLKTERHARALARFQGAHDRNPDDPRPRLGLGIALYHQREFEAAQEMLDEIPEDDRTLAPEALTIRAAIEKKQGRLSDAITSFRRALDRDPDHASAANGLLTALASDPDTPWPRVLEAHREWGRRRAARHRAMAPAGLDRTVDRPLRIGYVSPDLRAHPVGSLLAPVLEHHDRERYPAIVFADVTRPDETTARLRARASEWHDIAGLPDHEVTSFIRGRGIDLLVDLAGHTGFNRLDVFARRAAPVQVTWLGYPTITGLPTMDFRLTDLTCDPITADHPDLATIGEGPRGPEFRIRLEPGFCCFTGRPHAPPVNPPPASASPRMTLGSTHKIEKLTPPVLDLWSALVRANPERDLYVFRDSLVGSTRARLEAALVARGVPADRVRLESERPGADGFLTVYHEIDVLLDVFPWCGHATALDALWMGVPVVTLVGEGAPSRMTASMLRAIGRESWIARTPEEFHDIVDEVTRSREDLATERSRLRSVVAASPLADGARFTRGLETAYRAMWRAGMRRAGTRQAGTRA